MSHSIYIVYLDCSCGYTTTSQKPIADGTSTICPRCRTRQMAYSRPAGNGVPAAVVPQLASVTRANAYIDHILAKLGGKVETE